MRCCLFRAMLGLLLGFHAVNRAVSAQGRFSLYTVALVGVKTTRSSSDLSGPAKGN